MITDIISVNTIIIGAGPTGIGAAKRFSDAKIKDFLVIDSFAEAGGLASTAETKEGFLFDVGGHVVSFLIITDFFSLRLF